MIQIPKFDILIAGGSDSGMAARVTSKHNFLTRDGIAPNEISSSAIKDVMRYPTVQFLRDTVIRASKTNEGFMLETNDNGIIYATKFIVATGIRDLLPDITG